MAERGCTPFRTASNLYAPGWITQKVLLQSSGLGHKAAGLASPGRKCSRHHAGLLDQRGVELDGLVKPGVEGTVRGDAVDHAVDDRQQALVVALRDGHRHARGVVIDNRHLTDGQLALVMGDVGFRHGVGQQQAVKKTSVQMTFLYFGYPS